MNLIQQNDTVHHNFVNHYNSTDALDAQTIVIQVEIVEMDNAYLTIVLHIVNFYVQNAWQDMDQMVKVIVLLSHVYNFKSMESAKNVKKNYN